MKKLFLLLIVSSFLACDYVEEPFIEGNNGNGPFGEGITKVLLEEFTGHKCPNCPMGHAEIDYLMHDVFPGQIIPVSIHAGSFASTNTSYPTDYTTNTGDAVNDFFNIQAYPSGLVNRIDYNSNPIKNYQDWGTEINEILINSVTPIVEISITNQFNSCGRQLDSDITIEFKQYLEGTFMLCAWMTEDSLISKQKDSDAVNGYIENYIHMHVLRGAINSTWGDTIASGMIDFGYIVNKNFSINISTDLNENNCKVVAFIYNYSTNEVLQAEEKSFLSSR